MPIFGSLESQRMTEKAFFLYPKFKLGTVIMLLRLDLRIRVIGP